MGDTPACVSNPPDQCLNLLESGLIGKISGRIWKCGLLKGLTDVFCSLAWQGSIIRSRRSSVMRKLAHYSIDHLPRGRRSGLILTTDSTFSTASALTSSSLPTAFSRMIAVSAAFANPPWVHWPFGMTDVSRIWVGRSGGLGSGGEVGFAAFGLRPDQLKSAGY